LKEYVNVEEEFHKGEGVRVLFKCSSTVAFGAYLMYYRGHKNRRGWCQGTASSDPYLSLGGAI
jgi:hypothetical protein